MNTWNEWAEGLAAVSRRAGNENATAADFPYRKPVWTAADEVDGDDADNYSSDEECDRAADAYERFLGL